MILANVIAWGMLAGLVTYVGLPFYVLLQKQKADGLDLRWFDQVLLLVFGLADVLFNVLIGTAMFLDLPFQQQAGHREVTYSQRLKRLIHYADWRGDVARWVAETFIYRTDPDHLN